MFFLHSVLKYGAALHGSWLGQITLHSWRQVINLPCSRQSGLYGQNSCSRSQASAAKTPVQGRQASTAKALLLKAGQPPRSHISPASCSPTDRQLCHRKSLNGQSGFFFFFSYPLTGEVGQITLCAIRGVICVPLGPNSFYYSLLRKMKLKKEKIEEKKRVWKKTCRNDLVSAMMLVMLVCCRMNIRQGKNSVLKKLEEVLYS